MEVVHILVAGLHATAFVTGLAVAIVMKNDVNICGFYINCIWREMTAKITLSGLCSTASAMSLDTGEPIGLPLKCWEKRLSNRQ